MKYEETFEQCLFIFRAQFFWVCCDYEKPEQAALEEKIQMVKKKAESNSHDEIFIPNASKGAGTYKEFSGINSLSEKIRPFFPRVSFIFNIFPFLRLNWTSHPRKHYQKYCRFLQKYITPEEKEIIIQENLRTDEGCGHNGPELDCYAELFWELIQEEKKYIPVVSEIRYFFAS